jgi:hypothetical protein
MPNRKLPQSSYYLRAAIYGIDTLLKVRPMGEGFLFYTVGILASLRAVQHALLNHDSTLSPEHKKAIEAWKKSTPFDRPEITFIKNSRDLILKGGAFQAYATYSYGGIGEGDNFQMTHDGYETAYYVDGERRSLIEDMRAAADWCEKELSTIEAHVPAIDLPGDVLD